MKVWFRDVGFAVRKRECRVCGVKESVSDLLCESVSVGFVAKNWQESLVSVSWSESVDVGFVA